MSAVSEPTGASAASRRGPAGRRLSVVRKLAWQGRSTREIATALGVSENAVHCLRHRAAQTSQPVRSAFDRLPAPAPVVPLQVIPEPRWSDGNELLALLRAAVRRADPPSLREEIVAEAALLVLEGDPIAVAITEARKTVRSADRFYALRTRPIEGCSWL